MGKQCTWLATLALAWAAATPAAAVTIVYTTDLAPEAQGATGSGTGTVTLDTDLNTLRVETTWSGLSGTTTVAHLHCCTASPGTGTANVATTVPSFPNFPTGVMAGNYDMTFDLGMDSTYNPAFITANGGTAAGAAAALIAGLDAGTVYLNIHSSTFMTGEIRGFPVVPEPATGTLLLVALVALGAGGRRRRAA